MIVKDFIMKLDNAGIEMSFYGSELDDNQLIAKGETENLRKTYKEYLSGERDEIGQIWDRSVKKWIVHGMGESMSVYLNKRK